MEKLLYVFVIPVWGETHTRIFLDVCLPSMLTENNLLYLTKNAEVEFILYIEKSDEDYIKNNPALIEISNLAKIEFKYIYFMPGRANHDILSDCHKDGLKEAHARNGYAILPPPDTVWSNNSFYSLHNLALKGIKVIHMACLRLQLELVYHKLIQLKSHKTELSIPARDLVSLSMNKLHTITKTHFYNFYNSYGLMPANLLWLHKNNNILAHCFHLHPILLKPIQDDLDFKVTIDDDLLLNQNYSKDEIHIIQDSDEMLAYEISTRFRYVGTTGEKNDINAIVRWAAYGTNAIHRELIKTPIYLHSNNFIKGDWKKICLDARSVVKTILNQLSLSDNINPEKSLKKLSVKKKVLLLYVKLVEKIKNIESLILGTTINLRKLHWLYLAESKLFKPISKDILNLPGENCIVDEDNKQMMAYFRSSLNAFKCSYITQCVLIEDSDFRASELRFDHMIFICHRSISNLPFLISKAERFLSVGSKIIVYYLGQDNHKINFMNENITLVEPIKFAGIGCRLSLYLFSKLSKASPRVLLNNVQNKIIGFILKAIVRIVLLPTKILLYPIFGLLLLLLEATSAKQKFEKTIQSAAAE